jgi:hypothetical protein
VIRSALAHVALAASVLIAALGLANSALAARVDLAFEYAPRIPNVCFVDGRAPACVSAAIGALDAARAKLAQPPYALPSDFARLSGARQLFVLTNLDRILDHLPVIRGMERSLSASAMAGVIAGGDPRPGASGLLTYTANWAQGYPNAIWAYEAWMYDDGLGSANIDCRAHHRTGCWGHRRDVLWSFGPAGHLAMGAAARLGHGADPGYAMLIVQMPSADQRYSYTWTRALAAGAGACSPASRASRSCRRERIASLR